MGAFVAVPTRGRVWHATATRLALICTDEGWDLPHYEVGNASVADVRNRIVRVFLTQRDEDALVMCDDDIIPPMGAGSIVDFAVDKSAVVAIPCPVVRPGSVVLPNVGSRDGKGGYAATIADAMKTGIERVEVVGAGFICIPRTILVNHKLRAPFAATYSEGGELTMGEDISFCRRVRKAGYGVYADFDQMCEHVSTLHLSGIASAYISMFNAVSTEEE